MRRSWLPSLARVLDACASPGGKTTAIAAAIGDRGLIIATDVRGRRVDLLATRCAVRRPFGQDRSGRAAAAQSPGLRLGPARRAVSDSSPSAVTLTSGGGGPKPTFPGSQSAQLRC